MGFLNPIMLFGLLGVGVPILIHLLNRFRFREVDWGAMELLRRATVVRSRRVRIEDILVLVLRCLAVLLLALAMSRPTIRSSKASFLGGMSRVGVVIALDGSYSMQHRPGVNSRFSQALQQVRRICRTLQPGDQVTLLLMGQRPRVLLREANYDADRLDSQLKEAQGLAEPLNLDVCLDEAAKLMASVKASSRECYIVSDAQTLSWREVSDRAQQRLKEMDALGKVYFLSVATGAGENIAITDFQSTSGAMRQGNLVRYVARLTNFGQRDARNVMLTLLVNGHALDQRLVDSLPGGQSLSLPLYARFRAPGNVRVTATIEGDALRTDDARFAAGFVHEKIRVLLVDGDPGRTSGEGETFYLEKALVPKPDRPGQASLEITRITFLEMALHPPADYDVVMLANLPDVRSDHVAKLHSFVHSGGGLIVFPGEKTLPQLLNSRFKLGESSLLPAEIGRLVRSTANEGIALAPASPGHPLGASLGRLPQALMAEARVRTYHALAPYADGHVVLALAGGREPILVEKPLGNGRVLLFATSADRDWGNLAIHPSYVILLHEAVNYLTRGIHERPFAVGESMVIAIPDHDIEGPLMLHGLHDEPVPVQPSEEDGRSFARCPLPEAPGFCELALGPGRPPLLTAVNIQAAESDVRCLTDEELAVALEETPVNILPADSLRAAIEQHRAGRELWRVLMMLGVGFLLVESWLARRFSIRLSGGGSAIPPTAREAL